MIAIGVTGWTDHDGIDGPQKEKLTQYAAHFPVVEVDTSFYAIPRRTSIEKWTSITPEFFQFIPKAHASMTTHSSVSTEQRATSFAQFKENFAPMIQAGKVATFLFQFPPTFTAHKVHETYLRSVREWMGDLPVAVEFRHPSWFGESVKKQTFLLLHDLDFTHVMVDVPQTPHNSVPFLPVITTEHTTVIRLHGRNYEGWMGGKGEDWRTTRTLYQYSDQELQALAKRIKLLEKDHLHQYILFNNNSGGHAVGDAKRLQNFLGLDNQGFGPKQMGLF